MFIFLPSGERLVEVQYREANLPADGLVLYEGLRQRPYSFWLDSGTEDPRLSRYTFLGSDPFLVVKARDNKVEITLEHMNTRLAANPWDVLGDLLQKYAQPRHELPFPFAGGAVGYFGYDLGRSLEHLPATATDDLRTPDLYLGFYDSVCVIDHRQQRVYLVADARPANRAIPWEQRRLAQLENWLATPSSRRYHPAIKSPQIKPRPLEITGHFTRDSYMARVQKVKEYIAAGDIFQVNLSQRLACDLDVVPFELYRILRRINPAPFAAYLEYPELAIASASPERFIKVTNGLVETRPIKGTRPRGTDPKSDQALRQELWSSAKDRAELTMIVDLERNDLGRVCRPGSVQVPELFHLEAYATVFHLVATVTGALAAGKTTVDLLRASFPGGSITGAPKIRAMEIIEELEPVRRGAYTGAIGYLGFNGDADLNIVIRTFVLKDKKAYFQVGGGITADSDPAAEYQETLDKANALVQALEAANTTARESMALTAPPNHQH